MAGNVSLNVRISTSLPASAGIAHLAHATDAVITAIAALTSTSMILLTLSMNTG